MCSRSVSSNSMLPLTTPKSFEGSMCVMPGRKKAASGLIFLARASSTISAFNFNKPSLISALTLSGLILLDRWIERNILPDWNSQMWMVPVFSLCSCWMSLFRTMSSGVTSIAGLADEDEIRLRAYEVAAGEFFHLQPIDLRIELPVKGLQCFAFFESGFANTVFDGSFTPGRGLLAQQQIGEHEMGRGCFTSSFGHGIQIFRSDGCTQDLK